MPNDATAQLPPEIRELLTSFVRQRRRVAMVRAVGLAIAVAALWLLAWGLVDRLVALHWILRVVLLVTLVSIVAVVLLRPLRALFRRDINWIDAARQVEQRDRRFGEALATVVSQQLANPAARASPQLVEHLVAQVQSQLASASSNRSRGLVPRRPAATALAAAFAATFILFDLCMWPWLGLPNLLARQVTPLAPVPAVTTTRLEVLTGSTHVVQGRPLTIIARAQPPDPTAPVLRCTVDGQTWSSIPVTATRDGSLYCTLPSVTRDTKYQIQAGDAVSETYEVRVLRRPIVRELRIRLTYPAHVGREPLDLSTRGGDIEVPVGARASISAVCSEPLTDAWLINGASRLSSRATAEPNVRRFDVEVTADVTYAVDLLSDRGVSAAAAAQIKLRAIPDRPPIARMMLPEGVHLLRPTDVVIVAYHSADDYGLASVEARVQVNDAAPVRLPLSLGGDPRRCEGMFRLDLSGMNLSPGQTVDVSLSATDRAGQASSTQTFRMLIASHAVTPDQRRFVETLREAGRAARSVVADLNAIDATRANRAVVKVASACDTAPQAVQALLRAGVGSAAKHATLIAELVDEAQVLACHLEQLASESGAVSDGRLNARVTKAQADAAALERRITTLWHGQVSAMVQAAQAAQRELPSSRAEELTPLIASLSTELELDAAAADFGHQLQTRAEVSDLLIDSARPVDFVELARQWAKAVNPVEQHLPQRLSAASRAFVSRADADAAWSRDLLLASRAARSIDAGTEAGGVEDIRGQFASALAVLRAKGTLEPAVVELARRSMRVWTGEFEPGEPVQPAPEQARSAPPRAEPASRPRESPGQVETARNADSSVIASDSRQQALAAIRRAQEALARMPELLDKAEQGADWLRQTKQRAQRAQESLQGAAADQQPAARRALAAAQAQFAEASRSLSDIGRSLDPDYTWTMGRELQAIAPQTQSAVAPIEQELGPALETLHAAIEAADPAGTELSASDVRYAIALVQDGLRDARQALLERDPLVAARWFAQQTSVPASTTQPQAHQRLRYESDAAFSESDLPGYEDALRAYFQVLNESRSE